MDLSGIISISGRPGLFKVVAQGKNSIIVDSLTENKRFPAYASDRISALDDISIYTVEGDKPLRDIFSDIYKKQAKGVAPSHKEDITALQGFLIDILPNYDEERVYPSDIKKLFQWYNILHASNNLKPLEEEKPAKKEKVEKKPTDTAEKKPAAKKKAPAKKKPAAKKTAAKKPAAKKPAAKKKPAPAKKSVKKKKK